MNILHFFFPSRSKANSSSNNHATRLRWQMVILILPPKTSEIPIKSSDTTFAAAGPSPQSDEVGDEAEQGELAVTYDVVELQGTLAVPDDMRRAPSSHDDAPPFSSALDALEPNDNDFIELGHISRNPPQGKKCVLHIKTLAVEGEVAPCKRPMLILRKIKLPPPPPPSVGSTSTKKRSRDDDDGDHHRGEEGALATAAAESQAAPYIELFSDWCERVPDLRQAAWEDLQRACAANATTSGEELAYAYEVVGFAKNTFLFKSKPARIFGQQ